MSQRTESGQGFLTTLLGIIVLVAVGFALGLVVGVVSEEPDLVAGHVAGRSTEVDWTVPDQGEVGSVEVEADGETAQVFPRRTTIEEERAEVIEVPREAVPAGGALKRSEEGFSIQVGAFGAESPARAMASRLRDSGYSVILIPPSEDDRWRVRVGPVSGKIEAEQIARRLKVEEGLPTWVIAEKSS